MGKKNKKKRALKSNKDSQNPAPSSSSSSPFAEGTLSSSSSLTAARQQQQQHQRKQQLFGVELPTASTSSNSLTSSIFGPASNSFTGTDAIDNNKNNNLNKRRSTTTTTTTSTTVDSLFGSKEKYQKISHQHQVKNRKKQRIHNNGNKQQHQHSLMDGSTVTQEESEILQQRIDRTKSTKDLVESLMVELPSFGIQNNDDSMDDDISKDSTNSNSEEGEEEDDEDVQLGMLRLFVGQSTSILRRQGVAIIKNTNNSLFSSNFIKSLQSNTFQIEQKICTKLDDLGKEYRRPNNNMIGTNGDSIDNDDADADSNPSFRYYEVASRCYGRLDIRYGMDGSIFQSLSQNQYLSGIAKSMLGSDVVHIYTGLILSFPNSLDQPWHQDGPCLFPELESERQKQKLNQKSLKNKSDDDDEIIMEQDSQQHILPPLPPYALTFFIPVTPITEGMGPTEIILQSHHDSSITGPSSSSNNDDKWIGPLLQAGDVLIYDYRTCHRGTSNLSSISNNDNNTTNIRKKRNGNNAGREGKTTTTMSSSSCTRPMIYLLFARPWFREHLNFGTERLFPDR